MHDRMFVRWMTAANETGVEEIRATLGWVLYPLMPDSELHDLIQPTDDEDEPRAETVLSDLDAITDPGNLDTRDYLYRCGGDVLTTLAAAARRLDRLCKAEIKKRKIST